MFEPGRFFACDALRGLRLGVFADWARLFSLESLCLLLLLSLPDGDPLSDEEEDAAAVLYLPGEKSEQNPVFGGGLEPFFFFFFSTGMNVFASGFKGGEALPVLVVDCVRGGVVTADAYVAGCFCASPRSMDSRSSSSCFGRASVGFAFLVSTVGASIEAMSVIASGLCFVVDNFVSETVVVPGVLGGAAGFSAKGASCGVGAAGVSIKGASCEVGTAGCSVKGASCEVGTVSSMSEFFGGSGFCGDALTDGFAGGFADVSVSESGGFVDMSESGGVADVSMSESTEGLPADVAVSERVGVSSGVLLGEMRPGGSLE